MSEAFPREMDNEFSTQYHIQDVGKILFHVQKELARVKRDMDCGVNLKRQEENTTSSLMKIINRAQAELRSKTNIVLESTFREQPQTLPLIYPEQAKEIHPADNRLKHPLLRKKLIKKNLEGLQSQKNVSYMESPQTARASEAQAPTFRPMGGPIPGGKLLRGRISKRALVLPTPNRLDPLAPPPVISKHDAQRGLFSLMENGMIPKHVDITNALVGDLGVLQQRPARFHNYHEQFTPSFVSSGPLSELNNLKLDLSSPALDSVSQALNSPGVVDMTPRLNFQTAALFSGDDEMVSVDQFVTPSSIEDQDIAISETGELPNKEPRGFNELLDVYSLHQFLIRHGHTLETTPEFISFRRKYAYMWGEITTVISQLEALLTKFSIPLAKVKGKRVSELAEDELRSPSISDLLSCLGNEEEVSPLIVQPGQRFWAVDGKYMAAARIQATWKMFTVRKEYKVQRRRSAASSLIGVAYRLHRSRRSTREKIMERWNSQLLAWREKQKQFKKKWSSIQQRRRLIVHIPSLSREKLRRHSTDNFTTLQNAQMTRLFDLKDDNVEIIYVSPFPIPDEIRRYYTKLMEIGGVRKLGMRLRFLVPENFDILPDRMSTASLLYNSPKCLSRIRTLSKGIPTYISSNELGDEDLKVAVFLQLPLLAGEPDVSRSFSSASGSRRVFIEAGVETPRGATDIYTRADLVSALSYLIVDHLHVQRWIIKIDNENGSRGLAYFEPATLKVYSSLVNEHTSSTKWNEPTTKNVNRDRVFRSVKKRISSVVRIVRNEVYKHGWASFLASLERVGACIQECPAFVVGSPSANLFISPDGNVTVTSTHDQVFSKPYVLVGAVFPQSSFDALQIHKAAEHIGKVCYEKGIIGYAGVDFVVSYQEDTLSDTLLAVDLNLLMTTTQTTFSLFDFLMEGEYTAEGTYNISEQHKRLHRGLKSTSTSSSSSTLNSSLSSHSSIASSRSSLQELSEELGEKLTKQRFYASFHYVHESALSFFHHQAFFNLCRLQGVSFDLRTLEGTAFMLMDSLASGCLGLLCCADSHLASLKFLAKAIMFISENFDSGKIDSDGASYESNIAELSITIRSILKTQKQQQKQQIN